MTAQERHRSSRIGWLRAAVLGANDGILSTSSLLIGVAAAHATHNTVLVAGVAGLLSGATSMATGEYVSVHSQADTERADLAIESRELATNFHGELRELSAIYVARGVAPSLPARSPNNSWHMMHLLRMPAMNLESTARVVPARFRPHWPPRAASLQEPPYRCWLQ